MPEGRVRLPTIWQCKMWKVIIITKYKISGYIFIIIQCKLFTYKNVTFAVCQNCKISHAVHHLVCKQVKLNATFHTVYYTIDLLVQPVWDQFELYVSHELWVSQLCTTQEVKGSPISLSSAANYCGAALTQGNPSRQTKVTQHFCKCIFTVHKHNIIINGKTISHFVR